MTMLDINLIASRRARKTRAARLKRLSVYLVLALAAGNILLFAWLSITQTSLQAQIVACQKRLDNSRFQQTISRVRFLEDEIANLNPRVQLLEKVHASEGSWIGILQDIGAAVPTGHLWLGGIVSKRDDKGQTLSVSGSAFDQKAVGDLMLNVQTKLWSGDPQLSFTQLVRMGEQDIVNFEVAVPLKHPIGSDIAP